MSLDSRDRDSDQEKLEGLGITESPQALSRTTLSPADTHAAWRAHSWGQVKKGLFSHCVQPHTAAGNQRRMLPPPLQWGGGGGRNRTSTLPPLTPHPHGEHRTWRGLGKG